jgi:hypothetical protein
MKTMELPEDEKACSTAEATRRLRSAMGDVTSKVELPSRGMIQDSIEKDNLNYEL